MGSNLIPHPLRRCPWCLTLMMGLLASAQTPWFSSYSGTRRTRPGMGPPVPPTSGGLKQWRTASMLGLGSQFPQAWGSPEWEVSA